MELFAVLFPKKNHSILRVSEQFRQWLNENGAEEIPARVKAMERTTRELLQIVVNCYYFLDTRAKK
jgi:hypothetical protein